MAKKQADLPAMEGPGVAPVKIPQVDALAEAYIKERDKRLKLTPKEVSAKQRLVDALHAHADKIGLQPDGTIVYRYDTVVITLTPGKEKLKVIDAADVETEIEV
jgi:hypothetical protein